MSPAYPRWDVVVIGAGGGPDNAPMQSEIEFELRGDHITLDALLKATGLASSGGDAKARIVGGGVTVNGQVELRRGRKVRPGDRVAAGDRHVQVRGR